MRPRVLRSLVAMLLFAGLLFAPAIAHAQITPTPGATPEEQRPWTFWLSFPVLAGAGGLLLLVGFSYVRLSGRFYGAEEAPQQPTRRRQIAAPAVPPPVLRSTARVAAGPQGASAVQSSPSERPAPAEASTATAPAPQPAAQQAAPQQAAPQAAPAQEAPEEQKPTPQPAAQQAPSAPEHVEPDQETYDRELQAQLDKGVDRRVAEGRAKSAAIRAARAKASGSEAPKPAEEAPKTAEEAPKAEDPQQQEPEAEQPAQPKPQAEQQEPAGVTAQEQPAAEEPAAGAPGSAEGTTEAGPEDREAGEEEAARATEERTEPKGVQAAPVPGEAPPDREEVQGQEPEKKVEAAAPQAKATDEAAPADKPQTGATEVDLDQETFDRVKQEQLDKGVAQPVAEARARAAAIKAAREKAAG